MSFEVLIIILILTIPNYFLVKARLKKLKIVKQKKRKYIAIILEVVVLSTILWIIIYWIMTICSLCYQEGAVETSTPTEKQVSVCKDIMYINSSCKIIPLGCKWTDRGRDDDFWFKFETNADSIAYIFYSAKVDTTKFKDGFEMPEMDVKWWDVSGKKFTGGCVFLPNNNNMYIAVEKLHSKFIVYIFLRET